MYASDRRGEREYQGERYYTDEGYYYRGPNAGAMVLRDGNNDFGRRGYDGDYRPRGFEQTRNQARGQDRGRPGPQRRRSSWSPPKSRKHDKDVGRRRAQSRENDREHRMVAAVGGAIAGGFAGRQLGKGKKFDTVAMVVGAVVGSVGAREAAEYYDDRQRKNEEKEEAWEAEYRSEDERGKDRRAYDKKYGKD